jgi:hypothetical protein
MHGDDHIYGPGQPYICLPVCVCIKCQLQQFATKVALVSDQRERAASRVCSSLVRERLHELELVVLVVRSHD